MSIYGIDRNEEVSPTCCEGNVAKEEKTREQLLELVGEIEAKRNELGREGRFLIVHELGEVRKKIEKIIENI